MCIVFLVHHTVPSLPLVVAANRDEYFNRPTQPLHYWEDHPSLLAGRDLVAGGTWLGITRTGRLAMVTNYRDAQVPMPNAPSRGALLTDFLLQQAPLEDFCQQLNSEGLHYNGFNIIFGDVNRLFYYSNQIGHTTALAPGVYGLSNHLLDTPWPKITLGKGLLAELPHDPAEWSSEVLFDLLTNDHIPPDHLLPETGVGLTYERTLSSIFVSGNNYGTRSSTVLKLDREGKASMEERTYLNGFEKYESRKFKFQLSFENA